MATRWRVAASTSSRSTAAGSSSSIGTTSGGRLSILSSPSLTHVSFDSALTLSLPRAFSIALSSARACLSPKRWSMSARTSLTSIRARRLVEVVDVEDELALGRGEAAEVRHVGVAAELRVQAGHRRVGEVRSHDGGRPAEERERRLEHPPVADG